MRNRIKAPKDGSSASSRIRDQSDGSKLSKLFLSYTVMLPQQALTEYNNAYKNKQVSSLRELRERCDFISFLIAKHS